MRLAQLVLVPQGTAKAIVVTTLTVDLITVVPRHLPTDRQSTVVARQIAEVLPRQAFYITISSSLNYSVLPSKHVIIVYTERLLSAVTAQQTESRTFLATEALEAQSISCANVHGRHPPKPINTRNAIATLLYEPKKHYDTDGTSHYHLRQRRRATHAELALPN